MEMPLNVVRGIFQWCWEKRKLYYTCCGLAQKFRLIYHKNTD